MEKWTVLEDDLSRIEEDLKQQPCDVTFSYNYFPQLAEVNHKMGIPYISWQYDDMVSYLYHESIYLATNYIFCFDYHQYMEHMKRGVNAYYMPLAVDTRIWEAMLLNITKTDRKRFTSDVSFIGRLYSTETPVVFKSQGEYFCGYMDAVADVQAKMPSSVALSQILPSHIISGLYKRKITGKSEMSWERTIRNVVAQKAAAIERIEVLNRLNDSFNFALYTKSDLKDYSRLQSRGMVDYYTEMPKVFRLSKVNINITARMYQSAIPLRALDVIGVGGFLISNAQEEFYFYFKEGENIVLFNNLDEMEDKIRYYLAHEKDRKRIIKEGKKIVEKEFDLGRQLDKMLKIAFTGGQ